MGLAALLLTRSRGGSDVNAWPCQRKYDAFMRSMERFVVQSPSEKATVKLLPTSRSFTFSNFFLFLFVESLDLWVPCDQTNVNISESGEG